MRVTLNKDTDQLVGARGKHNHDSAKLTQFIKVKTKEMIENAVRNPTIAPRTVFKDLANTLLSSPTTAVGVGSLPKQSSLARTIQRKRKSNLGIVGNLPDDWEEYIIPEIFTVTSDNQPFVILDTATADEKKIWGFMSPISMNIAKNSSHLWVNCWQ